MAATKKKPTRKSKNTTLDPTPRHLWLASLGVLVAARRESETAAKCATTRVEHSIADVRYALRRAEADLRAGVEGVRGRIEPTMQAIGGELEARLAPIAARLGLTPKAKRAPRKTRKPAAKKAVARRTPRKPAKRVAKKAAR